MEVIRVTQDRQLRSQNFMTKDLKHGRLQTQKCRHKSRRRSAPDERQVCTNHQIHIFWKEEVAKSFWATITAVLKPRPPAGNTDSLIRWYQIDCQSPIALMTCTKCPVASVPHDSVGSGRSLPTAFAIAFANYTRSQVWGAWIQALQACYTGTLELKNPI